LNSSKLILGIFGAAFAAVTLFAVSFFVQMHREITTLRAQEATSRRRLAEAEAKLADFVARRTKAAEENARELLKQK